MTYGDEPSDRPQFVVNFLECLCDEVFVPDIALICLRLHAKLFSDSLSNLLSVLRAPVQ